MCENHLECQSKKQLNASHKRALESFLFLFLEKKGFYFDYFLFWCQFEEYEEAFTMKEKTVFLRAFVFLKSTSKKNLIKTFNFSQTILLECTVNSKTQKK